MNYKINFIGNIKVIKTNKHISYRPHQESRSNLLTAFFCMFLYKISASFKLLIKK